VAAKVGAHKSTQQLKSGQPIGRGNGLNTYRRSKYKNKYVLMSFTHKNITKINLAERDTLHAEEGIPVPAPVMMATRPAAILVPTSEERNVSIDAGENSIANNVNSK